jgi:hypothetical protein
LSIRPANGMKNISKRFRRHETRLKKQNMPISTKTYLCPLKQP